VPAEHGVPAAAREQRPPARLYVQRVTTIFPARACPIALTR